MLNDHDRHLLKDLERLPQEQDPAWVRQFKDPKPPRQARQDQRLGTPWACWCFSPPSVSCWTSPWQR